MGKRNSSLRIFLIMMLLVFFAVLLFGKSIARKFYPLKYSDYILQYSKEYNIDPHFVASVIKTESNFNEKAISRSNAKGLMQIMDDTAKWIWEQMNGDNKTNYDIYDPETNIKMGCWYINDLRKEFNSNLDLVLAAYNGGRGNVKNWLASKEHSNDGKSLDYIPFNETDKYIKKVKVNYNVYKFLYKDFGKHKE